MQHHDAIAVYRLFADPSRTKQQPTSSTADTPMVYTDERGDVWVLVAKTRVVEMAA